MEIPNLDGKLDVSYIPIYPILDFGRAYFVAWLLANKMNDTLSNFHSRLKQGEYFLKGTKFC